MRKYASALAAIALAFAFLLILKGHYATLVLYFAGAIWGVLTVAFFEGPE